MRFDRHVYMIYVLDMLIWGSPDVTHLPTLQEPHRVSINTRNSLGPSAQPCTCLFCKHIFYFGNGQLNVETNGSARARLVSPHSFHKQGIRKLVSHHSSNLSNVPSKSMITGTYDRQLDHQQYKFYPQQTSYRRLGDVAPHYHSHLSLIYEHSLKSHQTY